MSSTSSSSASSSSSSAPLSRVSASDVAGPSSSANASNDVRVLDAGGPRAPQAQHAAAEAAARSSSSAPQAERRLDADEVVAPHRVAGSRADTPPEGFRMLDLLPEEMSARLVGQVSSASTMALAAATSRTMQAMLAPEIELAFEPLPARVIQKVQGRLITPQHWVGSTGQPLEGWEWHSIGRAFLEQGQFGQALIAARRITADSPDVAAHQSLLAAVLLAAGFADEAIAAAEHALVLDGDERGASRVLVDACLLRGEPMRAHDALQALPEDTVWSESRRAMIEHALGHGPEVRDALRTAAALEGEQHAGGAALLAQAHAFMGDVRNAFFWLDKASGPAIAAVALCATSNALAHDPHWQALRARARELQRTPEGPRQP